MGWRKMILEKNQISLLPINYEHLQHLLTLPLHHNDPFDRLIISQALTEQLILVSEDAKFQLYLVFYGRIIVSIFLPP